MYKFEIGEAIETKIKWLTGNMNESHEISIGSIGVVRKRKKSRSIGRTNDYTIYFGSIIGSIELPEESFKKVRTHYNRKKLQKGSATL